MLNIRQVATIALAGSLLISVGGHAQTLAEPVLLNKPAAAAWNVYGMGQTHKAQRDKDVQGGGAIEVTIAKPTETIWDVGASTAVDGAIAKGDALVIAFYARVVSGGTDGDVTLPGVLQVASPPYAPIVTGTVRIGKDWRLVTMKGVAAADHPKGTTNVAVQLGGAAKKLALGPTFVMKISR
jgi:hypothetical protein